MLQSNEKAAILSERHLQQQLPTLSKSMSSCLVERISECLLTTRTITEFENQVISSQLTDMHKAIQLLQIVLRKGRGACTLFYSSLESCGPSIFERVTGLQALPPTHHHLEDAAVSERPETAPTYIINIYDSTLNNCIIGDGNYQSTLVAREQQQPLTQCSGNALQETMGSNSSCDHRRAVQTSPEPESIEVRRSQLKYVIIGDHNSMHVEETQEVSEEEIFELEEQ